MDNVMNSLRLEAAPRQKLTSDQRAVGQKIARVLRDMAQAKSASWHIPSRHLYLPRIDLERPNHVALIEGKRGSGKSTLLLTLLQRYEASLLRTPDGAISGVPNENLEEQRTTPDAADTWIEPSDYIVPVGIVDLEPLSSSSNLLFQLLSHLERVVVAIEGGRGPGESDYKGELRSRKKWRELARRMAASWDGNITERKAMLDPKDYAIEREDDELRRRNLFQNFTEFLDALVEEYKAWHPSLAGDGRLPFFLLSIDDADMSPKTFELLEIIRKFWHARLGYLMTGDSHLFRERIRGAIKEGLETESTINTLTEEVYDKVVPRAHRGQLRRLEPTERMQLLPDLRSSLEGIRLADWRMSLAEYLKLNEQAQELLPERPRGIWELEGLIREELRNERSPALFLHRLVHQLWLAAMDGVASTERDRIDPLLTLDSASGRLRIESVNLRGATNWRRLAELKADDNRLILHVGYPHRFGVFFVSPPMGELDEEEFLARQPDGLRRAMGGLMLAVDATWHGATRQPILFAPDGLASRGFVFTELSQMGDEPVRFPWPFPAWRNYVDTLRLSNRFQRVLRELNTPWTVEGVALAFLSAVIGQCLELPIDAPDRVMSWDEVCSLLSELTQYSSTEHRRARINAEWALVRAPLMAAPESGLPAQVANGFLLNYRKALGTKKWDETRSRIERLRTERVKVLVGSGYVQGSSSQQILRTLDDDHMQHRFREILEEATQDSRSRGNEAQPLVSELNRFKAPFSVRLPTPEKEKNTLAQYFNGVRTQLLGRAPKKLIESVMQELALYQDIHGSTADFLNRFWKILAEWYNLSELSHAVRVKNGQLFIDESLTQRLARVPAPEREHLASLDASSGYTLGLFAANWASLLLHNELPGAVDSLLRAIIDYVSDEQDTRLVQTPWSVSGWYGGEVRVIKGVNLRSWPLVAWPTIWEAERLEEKWAEIARLVAGVSQTVDTDSQPRYVDALAYWFLGAESTLMRYRFVPGVSLDIGLTAGQWGKMIDECLSLRSISDRGGKSGGERMSMRAKAYNRWLGNLPQMAMPEAGLTPRAAEAIIAALARNGFIGEKCAHLRDRLLEDVPSKTRKSLDQRSSDHPWFNWAKMGPP